VSSPRFSKILTVDEEFALTIDDAKRLDAIVQEINTFPDMKATSAFSNPYILEDHVTCVAGKLSAHITYAGEVLPCAFMNDRGLGNIKTVSLQELWNIQNPVMDELSDGVSLDSKCSSCEDRLHYFGNCIINYEYNKSRCKK